MVGYYHLKVRMGFQKRSIHWVVVCCLAVWMGWLAGCTGTRRAKVSSASPAPAFTPGPGIFQYAPGNRVQPSTKVTVDLLKSTEVGPISATDPNWYFSSLVDTFGGSEPALKAKFRSDFSRFLAGGVMSDDHPACPVVQNPNFRIHGYSKPYEFRQSEFMAWLRQNTPRTDFLTASARGMNEYLGDQRCPLGLSSASPVDTLKQSFGYFASADGETVVVGVDNRLNPWRWSAPINQVHHHEAASLYPTFLPVAAEIPRTEQVLTAFLAGARNQRIFLEYDIDLSVEDFQEAMKASDITGIYSGVAPESALDLHGKTHWNAEHYSANPFSALDPNCPDIGGGHGHVCAFLAPHSNLKWLNTRLIPPTIQVSLGVNFLMTAAKYRLAEFMLAASSNYESSIYGPSDPDWDPFSNENFAPTANAEMNSYIYDGGNNGNIAWTRTRIDGLQNPALNPVVSGGQFFPIPFHQSTNKKLSGVIDLTNYYAVARANQFFPGQRGYWNNQAVGFEGDVSEFKARMKDMPSIGPVSFSRLMGPSRSRLLFIE